MGGNDHLLSVGPQARLPLENDKIKLLPSKLLSRALSAATESRNSPPLRLPCSSAERSLNVYVYGTTVRSSHGSRRAAPKSDEYDTVSINETDSSMQRQENERNGTENVTDPFVAPPPKRNKKKNKEDDIGVELINVLNKNVELKKAEEDEGWFGNPLIRPAARVRHRLARCVWSGPSGPTYFAVLLPLSIERRRRRRGPDDIGERAAVAVTLPLRNVTQDETVQEIALGGKCRIE
ncbi:hypothetical protein EVAR_4305_1 [Eumeta japonica]|uniref:Uncharacterized protein n=1 Tax=Eumeta variegata TaxID=151549 RepID=A0A4C1VBB6_EUMVA|nr:hypothetical protein EVAR_4305_1 [Eumeta japonica]